MQQLFFVSRDSILSFCSHFLDLSTSLLLKNFFNSFGCSNIFYENLFYHKTDFRSSYLFTSTLLDLEITSLVLFISLNLRYEAPLVNSRLRKNFLVNSSNIYYYSLGLALEYSTFPVVNLGNSISSLVLFLEGKLASFLQFSSFSFFNLCFPSLIFGCFSKPFILLGSSIFSRSDANCLSTAIFSLKKTFFFSSFSISFITDFLGKISFFDINFSQRLSERKSFTSAFILLLGAHFLNEKFISNMNLNHSFIIFQGSFKNFLPLTANLLLPSKSYSEYSSSYFNINGYLKTSRAAVTSFRLSFSDSEILSIINITRKRFFFTNFSFMSRFYYILSFFSFFLSYKAYFLNSTFNSLELLQRFSPIKSSALIVLNEGPLENCASVMFFNLKLTNTLFSKLIYNYYSDNVYNRNSKIMSLCAAKAVFSTFSNFQFC